MYEIHAIHHEGVQKRKQVVPEGGTRGVFSFPLVSIRSIPCFITLSLSLIGPVDSRVDSKTLPALTLSLKGFHCHLLSLCAIIVGVVYPCAASSRIFSCNALFSLLTASFCMVGKTWL